MRQERIASTIDLVQLRTFIAVAEEKHLTRAAERLHVSQSAASAHVRAVEDALKLRLFVRTNRSLELTRAGELLLAKAKALLNEATVFASFAREISGMTEGRLVVASSSEPGHSRIGEIVSTLRRLHPLITVDLRARHSAGTRQGLGTAELDLGLLLGRPREAGFSCYALAGVPFTVAGPKAWAERIGQAGWQELAAMPWIVPTYSGMAYFAMLAEMFGERGLELNTVACFDNAGLGRTMVEAGVGLMLMREEHAMDGIGQGLLAASPIARASFPLYLVHLSSRDDDPLIRAFVAATRHVFPALGEARTGA
jgi:DNA-binding transcriptional LysR family regulator